MLVEDVCQAAGASFRGRRLGTFGDAGAFSLQFNKIITTGEGGVMITDRDDLYELAIDVHDCAGSLRRGAGLPRFPGCNFRASELQGAVARVQLPARRPARAHAREPAPARRTHRGAPRPDAAPAERRRRRRRHLPHRVRPHRDTAAEAVMR